MGKPSKAATTPRPGSAKAALKLKPPKHLLNDAAAAELADIYARKEQIESQLQEVERQIYDLETKYLDFANPQANALKGYEGLLLPAGSSAKRNAVKPEDRVFSGSSVSWRTRSKAQ